ncbi:MAG: hypothetical protein ACFE9L_14910 [Candidatus Hodarchaeota archaeon]
MEKWIDGDVYFSDYHYCNVSVKQNILTIKTLIYSLNNHSTSLSDTVQIFMNKSTQTETGSFPPHFIMIGFVCAITIFHRKGRVLDKYDKIISSRS